MTARVRGSDDTSGRRRLDRTSNQRHPETRATARSFWPVFSATIFPLSCRPSSLTSPGWTIRVNIQTSAAVPKAAGDSGGMRLSQLLATPSLRRLLAPAEPARDGPVRSVVLAEDFGELGRAAVASLVVLTRHASLALHGERADTALRRAAEQGVGAVVHDAAAPLSRSGIAIAHQGGVTLLRARDGASAGEIAMTAERELSSELLATLHRGSRALSELREAELLRCSEEELVRTVSSALGIPVTTTEHAQGGCSVPVRVD